MTSPMLPRLVTVQIGCNSVQKTRSRNAALTRQTSNRINVNFIKKRLKQPHGMRVPAYSSAVSFDSPHVMPYADQPEASRKYMMSSVKFCNDQAFMVI